MCIIFVMIHSSEPFGTLSASAQAQLDAVGAVWATDINKHRDLVVKTYSPLVQETDNSGIEVLRDLQYGEDERHRLDVYTRSEFIKTEEPPRDVLMFFHGGAFIRGNKSANGAIYDNVSYWFAHQGCVAVNVEYRLAPQAPYPSGAEDVIAAVRWVQQNIALFGGNVRRIFLMGHSAGGSHVAGALFDPAVPDRLSDADIAGAMLISARLVADVLPDNPNANGVRAYFGARRRAMWTAATCRFWWRWRSTKTPIWTATGGSFTPICSPRIARRPRALSTCRGTTTPPSSRISTAAKRRSDPS